ncbi:hypothetical protein PV325_003666 [Microctonus aethiopoides]|nr:hypothetical protein PV325_003666 [Microctonus aethiopoides]
MAQWVPILIAITLSLTAGSVAESGIDIEEIGDDVNVEKKIPDEQYMDVNIPGFDKKLPSPDELLKMLDSMSNLSDDEKNDIREHLMKSKSGVENNISPPAGKNFLYQIGLLLLLLSVIAIIFVFFGYKLYNSLVEKEKRRELKKKQKELKKKK